MQAQLDEVLNRFVGACQAAVPNRFEAVLYGSAARQEYLSDHSDLNLLLIVPDLSSETLGKLREPLRSLERHSRTPPLLFTHDDWAQSVDVFPIEIVDMQIARRVLAGPDPIAGVAVDRRELRLALERELRGKLLRLRQALAVHHGSSDNLARIGAQSIGTVTVLWRVALWLARFAAPVPTPEAIREAARVMQFDGEPAVRFFQGRGNRNPHLPETDFLGYLGALDTAVRFVDQFHVGGN